MRLTSIIIAVFFFNAPAYERCAALAASEKLETLLIRVSGGNVKFNVEVARTPKEQEMGLMFRRKLPKDRGMLFIYPYQSIVKMWMKNTHIPLDMVFINSKGIVKKNPPALFFSNLGSFPTGTPVQLGLLSHPFEGQPQS